MKQALIGVAMVLLGVGLVTTAFAAPQLELVSGNNVILWDGTTLSCWDGTTLTTTNGTALGETGVCATFGATGSLSSVPGQSQETVKANSFNGWSLTSGTGNSYAPNCSVTGDCLGQNFATTATAGVDSLDIYFGDSTFAPIGQSLIMTESATQLAGTATSTGYAFVGALGFAQKTAPTLSGAFGPLSLTGTGAVALSTGPVGTPEPSTAPYNIVGQLDFTPGAGSYNVTQDIAAVPEPAGVVLFGGVVLAVSTSLRRRAKKA